MANALLDFGGNGGVGFYAGVGAGRAWMSEHLSTGGAAPNFLHDKDSAWAWQGIAGLRVPLGEHVELGVKYKYLNTHLFRMVNAFGRSSRFDAQSHTLMASLLFNFGGAAPPRRRLRRRLPRRRLRHLRRRLRRRPRPARTARRWTSTRIARCHRRRQVAPQGERG